MQTLETFLHNPNDFAGDSFVLNDVVRCLERASQTETSADEELSTLLELWECFCEECRQQSATS